MAGSGDVENLRQVVDAGEVEGLGDESGGGGLIEKPLTLAAGAADGKAGVEGGGGAHGGGGERQELLAHGAPFQCLEGLGLERVGLGRVRFGAESGFELEQRFEGFIRRNEHVAAELHR